MLPILRNSSFTVLATLAVLAAGAHAQRSGGMGGRGGGGFGGGGFSHSGGGGFGGGGFSRSSGSFSGGSMGSSGARSVGGFQSGSRSSSYGGSHSYSGSRGFSAPSLPQYRSYFSPSQQRSAMPPRSGAAGRAPSTSSVAPGARSVRPYDSGTRAIDSHMRVNGEGSLSSRGSTSLDLSNWGRSPSTVPTYRSPLSRGASGPASARTDALNRSSSAGITGAASRGASTRGVEHGATASRSESSARDGVSRESILSRYQRPSATSASAAGSRSLDARGSANSSSTHEAAHDVSGSRGSAGALASTTRSGSSTRGSTTASSDRAASSSASRTERAREAQRDGLTHLTRLNATHPNRARDAIRRGETISTATSVGVSVGVAVGVHATTGSWCHIPPCGTHWGTTCHSSWWCGPCSWSWWGCSSFWWPWWGVSLGFGYWWGNYGYWWGGSPYYAEPYTTYYYAPPPVYYSTVISDAQPAVDATAQAAPPENSGESQPAVAPSAANDARGGSARTQGQSRAVTEYLAQGDKAFREARYNDAVLSYSRAVESAPDDGVLHLVFSDALFAAGEYHFAASAFKRALELDPKLLNTVVDKHGFYGDPKDFDRQLTQLERFVETHYADDDARLVLAANYVFAGRSAQAVEFLASASSASVRDSSAGQLVLARAQALSQAAQPKK
jgi:hypothetical protein